MRGDGFLNAGIVVGQAPVGKQSPKKPLIRMAMSVYKAGEHDSIRRVDHDNVFGGRRNIRTDLADYPIVDQHVCGTKCEGKYCTHFCPAGVYEWNEEQKKTLVSFGNCIECGACSIGCPFDNIVCHSPRGGYGAQFKHG